VVGPTRQRVTRAPILPAMKLPPKVEDYDLGIFVEANSFSAVLRAGRGQGVRYDYDNYPEAMAKADALRDAQGRQGLLYAIAPSGRSVCIDRKDRARYSALWQELHP